MNKYNLKVNEKNLGILKRLVKEKYDAIDFKHSDINDHLNKRYKNELEKQMNDLAIIYNYLLDVPFLYDNKQGDKK